MNGEEQQDNLSRHPADKRKKLLRTLLDEKQALGDHLLGEDDWESFQQVDRLPEATGVRIANAVKQGISQQRGKVFQFYLPGWYAVASMLLVVGGLSLFWKIQAHRWAIREQQRLAAMELPVIPAWKTVSNDTATVMHVVLADRSKVSLHKGANIRFKEPFDADRRDIQLRGKARFDVARDTTRPFTVLVGGFATTALGTSFTVDASAVDGRVQVWLHSGKVKLWHTDEHHEEQYLSTPGARGAFDLRHGISKPAVSRPKNNNTRPSITRNGTVLAIHNMALDNVITRLAKEYDAHIDFDRQALGKVSYTGTVDIQQERLEQVLQIICALNHLKLERTDEQHYRIIIQ